MFHIAEIDERNKVVNVIVVDNSDLLDHKSWWDPLGLFTGKRDRDQMADVFVKKHSHLPNTRWIETSDSGSLRARLASVGMNYMENVATMGLESVDLFICDKPYESWILDPAVPLWHPPLDAAPQTPLPKRKEGEIPFHWVWSEENYQSKDQLPVWILYQGMYPVE